VPVRDRLFSQGHAVLVVVVAPGHQVAHVEKFDGEIAVLRFAGRAVEVDQRHQVRRADSVARLLRRGRCELPGEEVGGAAREGQQVVLPGRRVMHAGGRDQVAVVVHLEVHRVAEARDLLAGALGDLDVGVDVAVGSLSLRDEHDELVNVRLEFLVAREGERRRRRFEPFIKIAVVPLRSAVSAF
jgi:hypothetical protein